MTNHSLPYFGQIDIASLEEYYRTEIDLNGSQISIDINFQNKSIDDALLQAIKTFLKNINNFNVGNKSAIESDFKASGETYDYISFYLDEFDQDELSTLIGIQNNNTPKEIQLLNKLKLIRLGIYPDGKYGSTYFGTFDYSIDVDGEPCNQLLVVNTDKKGALNYITWES